MISHLHGTLARKHETTSSIELDVGGVWYEVELPAFVWHSLEGEKPGVDLDMEVFYFVTSNAPIPRLLGFRREVEREFFKKLITVPNVGPTTAMKALIHSVSSIARWIEAGDTTALSRLPGIGKRTSETIVAQLRGKVTEEALLPEDGVEVSETPTGTGLATDVARDTLEALVGLGYSRAEADRLVQQLEGPDQPATVEDAIRAVFRRVGAG